MKKSLVLSVVFCALFLPFSSVQAGKICSGTNFNKVTLVPGCSTVCYEEPCKVYFWMPKGRGKYPVLRDNVFLGYYPAGRRVYLGQFPRGMHQIHLPQMQVPSSYLSVGGYK